MCDKITVNHMFALFHFSNMYKMQYFPFLAILFICFYTTFAVHTCYLCTSEVECKSSNATETCKTTESDTDHYLCQSIEYKTGGAISRGCMKNNAADISVCDALHLNDTETRICYHCDRELCNSGSISSGSVIIASIIAYLLVQFV